MITKTNLWGKKQQPRRRHQDKAWNTSVDFDLLAFNSVVRAIHKTARNIMETLLFAFLCSKRIAPLTATNMIDEMASLAFKLPFYTEQGTALGIIAKTALSSSEPALNLQELFPACKDPRSDLRNGYLFWRQFAKIARSMCDAGLIPQQMMTDITNADKFLEKKRSLWGF